LIAATGGSGNLLEIIVPRLIESEEHL
jgi:hypothetical protein